jgi:hypothetical protein
MGFELIRVGDDLYTVERKIPEASGIDTNLFRGYTNTTNVFRKDGLYWFCRLVEEAVIVEDEEPVIEKSKKRGRPVKKNLEE